MNDALRDRQLLIGVSGGISAYKTAALVSRLVQEGAGVSVVMTVGDVGSRNEVCVRSRTADLT